VELLFRTRRLMHEHVYQLIDVKGYEIMLSHVLGLCVHCLDLEWLKRHEDLETAGIAAEREL
jgi:HD superfamily phosphohydrolase